ncbi:DNA-3-methyladenine glycosylase family protein [Roseibium algae]|uniref:DNA-3-methyladenine glycosylase II n=1 Tax=Roseibium algae TaxID=3123038 RepID=A0ABU8TQE3_9HYPH
MKPINTLTDVESGLASLLELDPTLEPFAKAAGPLPLRRRQADFASLANIVAGQLVSVASAAAIFKRLEDCVNPLTVENFSTFRDEDLSSVGFSRAKLQTLRAICHACEAGLNLSDLAEKPANEAHSRLCEIKGIGRWSADIFLLFCAGHPDVFPSGDLAIRVAVRDAYGLNEKPSVKGLDASAQAWSPWRGIAARLFWAWYKAQKQKREILPL